jgi:hypothetical protein
MRSRDRLAISSRSAVLVAIVVMGAAAGIYVVSDRYSSAVISSSTFSSISSASSPASSVPTRLITISVGPSPGPSPGPSSTVLFGVPNGVNVTTQILPADTLAWTSWTLNSSASIGILEGQFFCPAGAVNSTIAIGLYANGGLVASDNASVASKLSSSGGSVLITSPLSSAMTFSAGTVIGLAVIAPVPIDQYVATVDLGVPTKEATLNSGSGVPGQLPSPTSTISETMQMWVTPPIT